MRWWGPYALDTGRGVERDGNPDVLDVTLGHAVAFHEFAGGIGAIDLEAQIGARIFLGEAHVVEHGAEVKQLRVVFQPAVLARERAPQEDAATMVVEQVVFGRARAAWL